ncbi:MAG: hypothetical protein MUP70_10695, partial [Candidatus Aminicenantes bacterium]|nr:hypothetical protein [Candidatus Aminicenantes bacterium]
MKPPSKEINQAFEKVKTYLMGKSSEPFSDKVITLAYEPINVGVLDNPDGICQIKGECGIEISVYLKCETDR